MAAAELTRLAPSSSRRKLEDCCARARKMRKLSASAGLGLGRSGTEPLKLGLGGGGKESALKAVALFLELACTTST